MKDQIGKLIEARRSAIENSDLPESVKSMLVRHYELSVEGLKIIAEAGIFKELNDLRVKYVGKSGEITSLMKSLKDVPADKRPLTGKFINELKSLFENAISEREALLAASERRSREERESLDVTLSPPATTASSRPGALHPLTLVKNDIVKIFTGMGFTIVDGPEVEYTKYNFGLLNIPEDHPARDPADSFYITPDILLRSQTSCVQARTMETMAPPFRIVCPGKVYRPDEDATHSPMFQQIEGLVVDKHVMLSDLKAVLEEFARKFFSADTKVRFRPSFFPFTEPSVEVDLSCAMCGGKGCRLCKGTGWLELLGAGVVNPAVFDMCGIDSSVYSGFAFGIGIERAAMIKYGIPDMRLLFDNDVRILEQFR